VRPYEVSLPIRLDVVQEVEGIVRGSGLTLRQSIWSKAASEMLRVRQVSGSSAAHAFVH
jgi:hypothetical protein